MLPHSFIPKSSILALMIISTSTVSAYDQNEQQRAHKRHGPPAQAIAACSELKQEDNCNFISPRGDNISGTCIIPRRHKESLICKPAKHGQHQTKPQKQS